MQGAALLVAATSGQVAAAAAAVRASAQGLGVGGTGSALGIGGDGGVLPAGLGGIGLASMGSLDLATQMALLQQQHAAALAGLPFAAMSGAMAMNAAIGQQQQQHASVGFGGTGAEAMAAFAAGLPMQMLGVHGGDGMLSQHQHLAPPYAMLLPHPHVKEEEEAGEDDDLGMHGHVHGGMRHLFGLPAKQHQQHGGAEVIELAVAQQHDDYEPEAVALQEVAVAPLQEEEDLLQPAHHEQEAQQPGDLSCMQPLAQHAVHGGGDDGGDDASMQDLKL